MYSVCVIVHAGQSMLSMAHVGKHLSQSILYIFSKFGGVSQLQLRRPFKTVKVVHLLYPSFKVIHGETKFAVFFRLRVRTSSNSSLMV